LPGTTHRESTTNDDPKKYSRSSFSNLLEEKERESKRFAKKKRYSRRRRRRLLLLLLLLSEGKRGREKGVSLPVPWRQWEKQPPSYPRVRTVPLPVKGERGKEGGWSACACACACRSPLTHIPANSLPTRCWGRLFFLLFAGYNTT
jgi:hypothetical protein